MMRASFLILFAILTSFVVGDSEGFEKEPVSKECLQKEHKVHHMGDLSKLTSICNYLSGDIIITDFIDPIMDFGSLVSINGSIKVSNVSNLVRINAPILSTIGDTFELTELTSLTSINLPHLKQIKTISWKVLPILSNIGFDAGLEHVENIVLSDTSLVGFSLKETIKSLNSLNLNNNRFLEDITSNVQEIKEHLVISANAKMASVSFPKSESVNNVTMKHITSLEMPLMNKAEGSMIFNENFFQNLKMPKLGKVGGTLSIAQNTNLKNLDFSNVSTIDGGLIVSNNSNIEKINFFPKLKIIGGAIQFIGDIKEITMTRLDTVKGSAFIKSSSNALDCSKWINSGSSVIRGRNIFCKSGDKKESVSFEVNEPNKTIKSSDESKSSRLSKPFVAIVIIMGVLRVI